MSGLYDYDVTISLNKSFYVLLVYRYIQYDDVAIKGRQTHQTEGKYGLVARFIRIA
jgi:hypothetical protein